MSRLLENRALVVVLAGIVSLASAIVFLSVLWTYADPRWQSNDDVAMSMVAHGYGIAAYSSPQIFFSNILWGHVVRRIPAINGYLGYSIGSLAALGIAGSTIVFFLLRLRQNFFIAFLAMVLILLQPALFPQFTMTAGLLAAAAVIGFIAYDRRDCIVSLLVACGLVFTGFLIRNLEVVLVFAVAAPALPWRRVRDRRIWLAIVPVFIALVLATGYDLASYRNDAWAPFRDLQYARAPFTDFGAMEAVLERPEILKKYGMSANDIMLVRHWFFVDRNVANPEVLKAILADIDFFSPDSFDWESAWTAVQHLGGPYLLALVQVAAGLLLLVLRARLLGSAALAVGMIVFLGGAGRPDVIRVFVPMASVVILIGLTMIDMRTWRRAIAVALVLICGVIGSGCLISLEADAAQVVIARARAERFEAKTPVVLWGGAMPLEAMFPPFTRMEDVKDTGVLGLGVFSFAPFALTHQSDLAGNGVVKQLLSPTGVAVYAFAGYMDLLSTYCKERHSGTLDVQILSTSMFGTLRQVKCQVAR